MRLNEPELVRRQYESGVGLAVRRETQRVRVGPDAFDVAFAAGAEPRRRPIFAAER